MDQSYMPFILRCVIGLGKMAMQDHLQKEVLTDPSKWIWFVSDPFLWGNLSSVPWRKIVLIPKVPPKIAAIQTLELGIIVFLWRTKAGSASQFSACRLRTIHILEGVWGSGPHRWGQVSAFSNPKVSVQGITIPKKWEGTSTHAKRSHSFMSPKTSGKVTSSTRRM